MPVTRFQSKVTSSNCLFCPPETQRYSIYSDGKEKKAANPPIWEEAGTRKCFAFLLDRLLKYLNQLSELLENNFLSTNNFSTNQDLLLIGYAWVFFRRHCMRILPWSGVDLYMCTYLQWLRSLGSPPRRYPNPEVSHSAPAGSERWSCRNSAATDPYTSV